MTHFVTEKCIKCKYTDCVEVCPVDCFYEGINMLVIDPEQCIDCGVCIPECPIDAIVTDDAVKDILQCDDDTLNEEQKKLKVFYNINAEFAKKWENITSKKSPMNEADLYKNENNKVQYFNENIT
ncbi:ferredoxin family protein [Neoehrlichia mikurensis]|uniref:Ferredoxin n=1 Tax=Neoehrlichia mikurensis TaxID=89586 RepID=A0A9Q9BTP4_9RICK|nr:ferredoxin family protein [Neoehrlichia mikurensis]QXK92315.1 ferredoxin family protein [Neoehrlichia mikurensis]QXK92769.1 ferredoxin family protein [Neoehrlichia mikurensis]QXK94010.1 ferredoxin family protein [Neoehrlichia mikurensis]UTO55827.1 ferredoxin family protein [Neoehrlichia mikurensis]UTO56742.1 ferredoxin family protein [Neoehrlichia mikurensis]